MKQEFKAAYRRLRLTLQGRKTEPCNVAGELNERFYRRTPVLKRRRAKLEVAALYAATHSGREGGKWIKIN
jgi:hypothetical protein